MVDAVKMVLINTSWHARESVNRSQTDRYVYIDGCSGTVGRNYNALEIRLLYGTFEIKFRKMARCVKHTRRRIYHNANHARSPLSPVIYRVRSSALSPRKREINFQSTSHVMTVISLPLAAAEALHEKDRLRNWQTRARARDSDGDLKVSIKRGSPSRARSFSAIDHVFHYGPYVRRTYGFSLYRRAIGRRKRLSLSLSCFTSLLLLCACGIACDVKVERGFCVRVFSLATRAIPVAKPPTNYFTT